MYDAYSSVAGWMIAGGPRIDEPDARNLEHLMALREVNPSTRRPFAPFAWISERLGNRATARVACNPLTCSAAA